MGKRKVNKKALTHDLLRVYASLAYEPVRKLIYSDNFTSKNKPLSESESHKALNELGDAYTLRNIFRFENIAIHSINVNSIDFVVYIQIIFRALQRSRLKRRDEVIAYLNEHFMRPPCYQLNDEKFREKYHLTESALKEVKQIMYSYVNMMFAYFIPNYDEMCDIYGENKKKRRYRKVRTDKSVQMQPEDELEIIWQCFYEAMDQLLNKEENEA